MGYAVRSKECKICENGDMNTRIHDCRKNWTGSSKAMEGDIAVEVVKTINKTSAKTVSLTMDDDTTTIHKLRTEINQDIEKRPDMNHTKKVNAPVSFPVKILQDSPVVVFDLETTSFGIDSSICQIAASYDGKIFDEYVDPCQPIHPAASNVTGLTYTCGKLFHNFNLVPTLSQKDALESFIEWIPLNSVLVAHNCKNFDARILVSSVQRYGLLDKLKHKHCCFSDTLSVFREILPPRSSYSEENLVNDYLHTEYSAHNAKHD
uniref:Uncharacterized protein LOC102808737 n=1 Tax=Saccoglossus kowalevskii TaxID=10224 RepID=A0ABM0LZJ0_SACKO